MNDKLNLNISEMPEILGGGNIDGKLKDLDLSPISNGEASPPRLGFTDAKNNEKPLMNKASKPNVSKPNIEEPKKEKKITIRRARTSSYNWTAEGQVEIKTISYKIKYNHTIKGFRVLKANDRYTTSILSWKPSEDEDGFDFTLQDCDITELRGGNSIQLTSPAIKFIIDFNGKFVNLTFFKKKINACFFVILGRNSKYRRDFRSYN